MCQVGVLLEGLGQEVQEPGLDDRPLSPGLDDLAGFLNQIGGLQDGIALGQRLHHSVLDAVMDHLGVVSGTGAACVNQAELALGLQGVEYGLNPGNILVRSTDHQGVAVLPAPDAIGGAHVDQADALRSQGLGMCLVLGEAGVAPVDDQVAAVQQVAQLVKGGLDGFACGHHDPDGPGCLQGVDQGLEAVHVPARLGRYVVPDDLVTACAQAVGHVLAHAAQAYHSDLHDVGSFLLRSVLFGFPGGLTRPLGLDLRGVGLDVALQSQGVDDLLGLDFRGHAQAHVDGHVNLVLA